MLNEFTRKDQVASSLTKLSEPGDHNLAATEEIINVSVNDEKASREQFVIHLRLLWERRPTLLRFAAMGLILGVLLALVIPKQFISTARLMPPEQGSSAAMMAALAGKVGDSLAGLGGLLPGMKTTGELFVGILSSRTVQDEVIRKFDLRTEYGVTRWEDARKILAAKTNIMEDRKSGIITLQVVDRDPKRAAAMAGEYVGSLNRVVVDLNTSSAHRERVFLEERLTEVKQSLGAAEREFSEFASKNKTIDLKEQGRAMVEAAAALEGELIAAQTQLQGLRQVYTDSNVRVRATQAKIDELRRQLRRLGGQGETTAKPEGDNSGEMLYPSIRRLPLLGVTFTDLYRSTRIQEAVFETLTKQYELAKVEEAKEVPSVRVLDPPDVPEKKSFPPRTLITLMGTFAGFLIGVAWLLGKESWTQWDTENPGRILIADVGLAVHSQLARVSTNRRLVGFVRNFGYGGVNSAASGNGKVSMADPVQITKVEGTLGKMRWEQQQVLVTGGASFIGSALVDALVERGAKIRVIDNLSSGRLSNLQMHLDSQRIEFLQGDLLESGVCQQAVEGCDYVFHLAADHGGRGYVDLHQTACSTNLILDGLLFRACNKAGVEKVVFASSGCIYPNLLQADTKKILYLTEEQSGPPYDADNLYGWAKLMAEKTLQAYYREHGMKSASCRYFTVYGERGHENHAVIAMIARAFVKQDPFIVWGTGEQIRNWTYVGDIVEGTIRAAEVIEDGTAVNLGTMERIRVLDAVSEVLRYTGHGAKIELHPELPTGPLNRVADNTLARRLLNWEPKVRFVDGLHRTIEWYFSSHDRQQVAATLDELLTERVATNANLKTRQAVSAD
jgi:nucleoside-diphosphate-sugar epimerase/capsule polysaccharide export protein KpsE/RkpR